MENQDIVVIGPTASGKTKLSIAFAQKLNLPIVNCDTRQFWKNLRKISCSPTKEEIQSAEHLLFNCLENDERPSLGYWMNNIINLENKIIVGGSMFYPYCLSQGIPRIEISESTIKKANEVKSIPLFFEQVGIKIHQNDQYRLRRMLEFYLETGCDFQSFPKKFKRNLKIFAIDTDQNKLNFNIKKRIEKHIDLWIEECIQNSHENFSSVIGYKECLEYYSGRMNMSDLKEKIALKTIQYSKRQIKFMRRFKPYALIPMDKLLYDQTLKKVLEL